MKLPSFWKKSPTRALTGSVSPSIDQSIGQLVEITKSKIERGLSNPVAGTGKPIEELHGAAKWNAQIANIGGGSKANGGGGMTEGMETIFMHGQALGLKKGIDYIGKKKLKR